jgi:hypothetical protein
MCSFVCQGAFLDCNGAPLDGCEVNGATDAKNCGSCKNACPVNTNCVNGKCM